MHQRISPSLKYFQEATKAPHAFQVVVDMPYVQKSCFDISASTIVPARIFLP